jgi:aminoglycoside phosphotransferase (APT) family kinase protein
MRIPKPIRHNLHFLLAETSAQAANLQSLLKDSSPTKAQQLLERRGYSHSLKMRIHHGCIEGMQHADTRNSHETYSLRAAEAIASKLDRLTELIQDCAGHLVGSRRRRVFRALISAQLLDEILGGIQLARIGLDETQTQSAVKLGKLARRVRTLYQDFFQREANDVNEKHSQDFIAVLLIAQRLNEMGVILLDISEAMLSAMLGHPLNVDRFSLLESTLTDLGVESVGVESIAQTKSGSNVSGIANGNGKKRRYAAILKDGQKKKLIDERDRVESWHEIFPGLAPRILSYRQDGSNAALLVEHLPGQTLEQILLNGSDKLFASSLKHLNKTLRAIWTQTKRQEKTPAQYMEQLRKRLGSVRQIHKELGQHGVSICGANAPSLERLIKTAAQHEQRATPPFSVYIHGDFNLDNVIFNPKKKSIRFVDLHRSRFSDYVQDVSVFMVSNYRLQVLDARTRRRIRFAATTLYEFADDFARQQDDDTFELRLAFGLARSFITSTRFILDDSLAKRMYLRGYYLLERIVEHRDTRDGKLRLPIRELFS